MNKKTKTQLNELDQQIKTLLEEGNRGGAAALHAQKALLYASASELQSAAKEISKMGILAEEEGRFEELALANLAHGKTLAAKSGGGTEARDVLQKAAAIYHTLEDVEREAESFKALAEVEAAAQNFDGAVNQISRGIKALDPDKHGGQLIDLLMMRSSLHLCRTDFEAARQDLKQAGDIAGRSNNAEMDVAIQAQLQLINSFVDQKADPEMLERLRQQATRLGNFKVVGDVELQQANLALIAGRLEEAKTYAAAVRKSALKADDLGRFVRHLSASVTLASVHNALDEKKEVLYTLLTCKLFLEKNLGKAMGRQVNLLLDAYKERWGAETMAQAVKEYQAWMKEQRSTSNGN